MMMMMTKRLLSALFGLVLLNAAAVTDAAFVTTTTKTSTAATTAFAPALTRPRSFNPNVPQQQHQTPPRRNGVVLFMGWGPEPIWSSAKITQHQPACASGATLKIVIQVPPETAAAYTIPGQYVQLRLNDAMEKPLFLAMASAPAPENDTLEFLVKKTASNAWLTSANVNTAVQISQVLGKGFSITDNLDGFKYDFPTQNVLLFAAGSGIAPIKAAAESGLLQTDKRTARLYYGERTAADLCCVDQFAAWEDAGIQVVPVLSQPELHSSDSSTASSTWQGRTGYVQTALAEDGIAIPRNSAALMCGMKGMTEAVKTLLLQAGVFEGRILLNF